MLKERESHRQVVAEEGLTPRPHSGDAQSTDGPVGGEHTGSE